MNNNELYNSICNAKIKDSIFLASRLILSDINDTKHFDSFIQTCVAVCGYIGSFVSVYEVKLWINTMQNLQAIMDDEKIVMKDIYVLITKLCILCDIYVKNPVTKTGAMNIKLLREKIIHMFSVSDFKLSDAGTSRFEGVLPPADSPSYSLAMQVITGYVYVMKQIEKMSADSDADKISDIANNIRRSFDYIIRKKYIFETKFYESDNDAVWFLWGIICLLYDDAELNAIFRLFSYDYNKKNKNARVGLIWGAGVVMAYVLKKDIGRNWNKKELQVIMKIEEVSLQLYKDIKRELIETEEVDVECVKRSSGLNGLEYICNARHLIGSTDHNDVGIDNNVPVEAPVETSIKLIKCKRSAYI